MSPETKLWISRYVHVTWRMPPWMPWSDSPRAAAAPSRGGAGHQERAGNGLQTEITLSRWLTDYIFRSTVLSHSLRHMRRGLYSFRHGTWQVSLIPSGWLCLNWLCGHGAVSCQLSGHTPVVSVTDTDCSVSRLWHQPHSAESGASLNRAVLYWCFDIISISRYTLKRELMDAKPKYSKIGMSKFDWKLHWSCPEGKWWNSKHKRLHAMWDCSEMRVYDFHWQWKPAMKLKL